VKLLIFSDPHLFTDRKQNFTRDSSERREKKSQETLKQILDSEDHVKICVGDFFNSFSNSETKIVESEEFALKVDFILAGNHDHSKNDNVHSSLDVLSLVHPNRVIKTPTLFLLRDNIRLYFVPHCLLREQFEKHLSELSLDSGFRNLLFLHCNYAPGYETDDSTLVLTKEMAQSLVSAGFDRIFMGHEHAPRDLMNGKLTIVGNHFPTNFSDLSDKRYLIYDSETDTLESHWVWKTQDRYYKGHISSAPPGLDFYDLESGADPKAVMDLFKEGALGIRVSTPWDQAVPSEEFKPETIESLPNLITRRIGLEEPELRVTWQEIMESVRAD